MSLWDRRSEKKAHKMEETIAERRTEIEQKRTGQPAQSSKEEEARAIEEARNSVSEFTSWRTTLKKSMPQILIGIVLAYVEYRLIGTIFTLGSLVIYIPIMFFYSKSLREARGKYLLAAGWDEKSGKYTMVRYLIPDELWDLITFKYPPLAAVILFNRVDTYVAEQVKTLPGTNIVYWVKLAWEHLNSLEFLRSRGIIPKLSEFALNSQLALDEKEWTEKLIGLRTGKEMAIKEVEGINSASHESLEELKERLRKSEEKIDKLVRDNKDLLFRRDEDEMIQEGEDNE